MYVFECLNTYQYVLFIVLHLHQRMATWWFQVGSFPMPTTVPNAPGGLAPSRVALVEASGLDFELAYRCADEGTQGGRPAWMAALQGTVFP